MKQLSWRRQKVLEKQTGALEMKLVPRDSLVAFPIMQWGVSVPEQCVERGSRWVEAAAQPIGPGASTDHVAVMLSGSQSVPFTHHAFTW